MTDYTLTYSASAGDCWADAVGSFDSTATNLYIGAVAGAGDTDPRTWIPFTVNLPKGITVVSATLRLQPEVTSSAVTSNIKTGCEAADNPSAPTTKADLFSRTMTTATNTVTLSTYTLGVTVSYDMTSAVQEVLNRSGWASGNTLACMIHDVDTVDKPHSVISNEGGANKPVLEIVVRQQAPRGSGLI